MDMPIERFWTHRGALRRVRAYQMSMARHLFSYSLEDTRTGERTPA